MIQWLLSAVPWYAWAAAALIGAGIVYRLIGWPGVLAVIAAFVGVIGFKRGAEAERAKQDKADADAVVVIAKAKQDVRAKSDQELEKEVQKWTRP